jgi:2-polyprenyl-3-methyl-5-hydroxy-6-metoxy-1,4-benzoquinol methylase
LFAKKHGFKFTDIVGYDVNSDAIKIAIHKTGNGCRFIDGSIRAFLDINEHFDIITMHESIEHTPNPLDYIIHAKHMLKDINSILQLTTPYVDDTIDLMTWDMARNDHYWLFTVNSLKKMMDLAGFDMNTMVVEDFGRFTYQNCIMMIIHRQGT